uniref:type II toxin-antitoxin system death-on-curing family toxin n=1 Tax=Chitinophaga sp. TaxID=1869181 RepID=UPI00262B50F9
HERNLNALKNTIQIMGRLMDNHRLTNDESAGLISLLNDYSYALDVLDKYDHQQIPEEHTSRKIVYTPTYEDAIQVVALLKNRYPSNALFGNEKDMSFRSSLASINQTFDGRDLYPSIEVKAAHLLYFIVKNHSFSDGNKRIAAFLLVWYMDRNNILYKKDGNRRISDNSLVALTLMIAESDPAEKDVFIQVVVSLINGHN